VCLWTRSCPDWRAPPPLQGPPEIAAFPALVRNPTTESEPPWPIRPPWPVNIAAAMPGVVSIRARSCCASRSCCSRPWTPWGSRPPWWCPRPRAEGFRNSVKLRLEKRRGRLVAGLYDDNSHRVLAAEACPDHHPMIGRLLPVLLEAISSSGLPIYREASGEGLLSHLVIRALDGQGTLVCLCLQDSSGQTGPRSNWPLVAGVPAPGPPDRSLGRPLQPDPGQCPAAERQPCAGSRNWPLCWGRTA
jgi:hypothetical protein